MWCLSHTTATCSALNPRCMVERQFQLLMEESTKSHMEIYNEKLLSPLTQSVLRRARCPFSLHLFINVRTVWSSSHSMARERTSSRDLPRDSNWGGHEHQSLLAYVDPHEAMYIFGFMYFLFHSTIVTECPGVGTQDCRTPFYGVSILEASLTKLLRRDTDTVSPLSGWGRTPTIFYYACAPKIEFYRENLRCFGARGQLVDKKLSRKQLNNAPPTLSALLLLSGSVHGFQRTSSS